MSDGGSSSDEIPNSQSEIPAPESASPMLRSALILTAVLAVPVLPLLVLGLSFESQLTDWLSAERSPTVHFLVIVAILATDIFLPVPSSAVSTYAGGSGLGMWPAVAASWIGMTLGAVIGFSLARGLGDRFTTRFAGARDLDQMSALTRKYGPMAIVLTRALPILAEACVLLMGATGLSWRRFLPAMILSNLAISITYAAFGVYFAGTAALPAAIVASGTVPLAVALLARKWMPVSVEDSETNG